MSGLRYCHGVRESVFLLRSLKRDTRALEQAGYYRKLGLSDVPGRAFEKDGQRYVIMEMPLRRPTAREK